MLPARHRATATRKPGQVVGKTGKEARARATTGRRPPGRRLLRDRRHPRRAHRHHVRGPRAPEPRAASALREMMSDKSSQAKRLSPRRHPRAPGQAPQRQAARDADARLRAPRAATPRIPRTRRAASRRERRKPIRRRDPRRRKRRPQRAERRRKLLDADAANLDESDDATPSATRVAVKSASRFIRTTCATSTSRPTPARSPTPS